MRESNLFDGRLEVPDWELPTDAVWRLCLETFFSTPGGRALRASVENEVELGKEIFPPRIFRAFHETSSEDVRVVILGQDPYHGQGQAEGLAFSVPEGMRIPPSLRNIKKELQRDLRIPVTTNGSLLAWARQGVLLLNAIMTVESGKAASHRKLGWEALTDRVIQLISTRSDHVVFMLWGNFAQSKEPLIDRSKHLVLCANHPSPLSATRPPQPFIGCSHFSIANRWLAMHGKQEIDWKF